MPYRQRAAHRGEGQRGETHYVDDAVNCMVAGGVAVDAVLADSDEDIQFQPGREQQPATTATAATASEMHRQQQAELQQLREVIA